MFGEAPPFSRGSCAGGMVPFFARVSWDQRGTTHTTGPKRNGSMHQENAAAVWIYIPVIYLHSRGNVQDKNEMK